MIVQFIITHYNIFKESVGKYSIYLWASLATLNFLLGIGDTVLEFVLNRDLTTSESRYVALAFAIMTFFLFFKKNQDEKIENVKKQEMIDLLLLEKDCSRTFRESYKKVTDIINSRSLINHDALEYAQRIKYEVRSQCISFSEKPYTSLIYVEHPNTQPQWSVESLYETLRSNVSHNKKDIIGTISQIVHQKEIVFVEYLLNMANTYFSLDIASFALKAVSDLTNHEAYLRSFNGKHNGYRSDIIECKFINKWWDNTGCNTYSTKIFEEEVFSRNRNYNIIDEVNAKDKAKLISQFESSVEKYPKLGKSMGILSFLYLQRDNVKAKEYAEKSLKLCNSEVFPFLTLAFLTASSDIDSGLQILDQMVRTNSRTNIIAAIEYNSMAKRYMLTAYRDFYEKFWGYK